MFWRSQRIIYGMKNFKNQMGIKDNVTLAGLIRRSERRHPKIFSVLKKTVFIGSIYFILMNVIPGSSFPLQTAIKKCAYSFDHLISKTWYYNWLNPNGKEYLIKLNQIMLMGMDNQIYQPQFIIGYLQQIKEVTEQSKKQLKNDNYLDLLIYSEVILQNIIRYEKKILPNSQIVAHFQWMFSIIMGKLTNCTITQKQTNHIKLIYILIQYLLNFGNPEQVRAVIHCYAELVKQADNITDNRLIGNQKVLSFKSQVMKRGILQNQFKSSLKKYYSETTDQQSKTQILNIFQKLNEVYLQQQNHSITLNNKIIPQNI